MFSEEVISSVVIILLFIIERILSYSSRSKDRRYEWYLTVIVYPHQDRIDSFFRDFGHQSVNSINEIKRSISGNVHTDVIRTKALSIQKVKSHKRSFIVEFVNLLVTYDPSMYQKLNLHLNALEDRIVSYCDDAGSLTKVEITINKEIEYSKKLFFSTLYEEVQNQYPTSANWRLIIVAFLILSLGLFIGYVLGYKTHPEYTIGKPEVTDSLKSEPPIIP